MKKIYFFIGTTAELIKLAPVIRELEKRKINFKIIASGQTNVNFEELSFLIKKNKADIAFPHKTNKSSMLLFSFWSMLTIFRGFALRGEFAKAHKTNTFFIVHGDPVSSLIGALIAKFFGLKLVHVESGLRSFNYLEPFPEEITRQIISKLANVHFAPNEWALQNLLKSPGVKINTKQNTMLESYLRIPRRKSIYKGKYFVLIVHRQEHVIFDKQRSKQLIEFILQNIGKDMKCVFIRHDTTANFLESVGFKLPNNKKDKVIFAPRFKYIDFVNLIRNSEFLVTDGGGNQEEAYYMGLPCLLLRNYTERIEGLSENIVLSKGNLQVIKEFMDNYMKYRSKKISMRQKPSKIIVDYLVKNS